MLQQNVEFALHVHKKTDMGAGRDLYTIGIWTGPTLVGICHVQPLDSAVRALRKLLDQTGKPQTTFFAMQHNEAQESTGLRRVVGTMLATLAGFIKSVR